MASPYQDEEEDNSHPTWELIVCNNGDNLKRIIVPGGYLYRMSGSDRLCFVPLNQQLRLF